MNFEQQMMAIKKKAEQAADKAHRATVLQLTSAVVYGTPVDTGRAKGNWVASIGEPARGYSEDKIDRDGGATINSANGQISVSFGKTYYLTNNVPYIGFLEYGTINRPAIRFVEKAVQEFNSAYEKNLKNAAR